MSRLEGTFSALRQQGRRALVAFATAGDPDGERSAVVIKSADAAGADVIEVGVPYSDPVADGPVIQRASERARRGGTTLESTLDLVAAVRGDVHAPVVLFTYANPVFRFGVTRFADRSRDAGVDGVLMVDLPVEESDDVRRMLVERGIDPIFLVSPTTSDARLRATIGAARGFVYVISRVGTTGAAEPDNDGVGRLVDRVRCQTALPVAVGFGISRPEHVRAAVRHADAAVVGSALVAVVERAGGEPDLREQVEAHVRWLRTGLDEEA